MQKIILIKYGELTTKKTNRNLFINILTENIKRKRLYHMREKVLACLQDEFPDIDFEYSDALVDDGIIDSLTITGMIAALSMEFGIVIPYEDIIESNFNSIDALAKLVERLQG